MPVTDRERARRAVADLLVAELRRHRQVPDRRHAGRQPGRGRHPRPARAGAAQRRASTTAGRLLVALGLFGAALLYGDGIITPAISVLGAVEGLSVATPALPAVGGADRRSVIILALFAVPAARDGRDRRGLRADHGGLVRLHRGARGPRASCGSPRCWRRSIRGTRSTSSCATGLHGLPDAGRGGAGGHRRRGAVRRHGPLRPAADPARLVRGGVARAGAQLLRAGRYCCCTTRRRRRNPFYALVPELGPVSRWWRSPPPRRSSPRRR